MFLLLSSFEFRLFPPLCCSSVVSLSCSAKDLVASSHCLCSEPTNRQNGELFAVDEQHIGCLQEHLFDVSDLQDREPALISKCGTLEVVFNYSAIKAKMTVKVGVARDIPTKERGGASNVQVRSRTGCFHTQG